MAAAQTGHLEPRVARVESGLEAVTKNIDSLTNDVKSLAASVRHQGENFAAQMHQQGDEFSKQLQLLHVAVTNAAAPRKTDWSTIISAVSVVMAIGAAAFGPVYLRLGDMQKVIETETKAFHEHEKLQMHPVGMAKVEMIEDSLTDANNRNVEAIKALDDKLKNESKLIAENIKDQMVQVAKELHDVKYLGSPITRERLAVIEEKLKIVPQRLEQ